MIMYLNWIDLLSAFEVSPDTPGGADFAELVLRLVNHYRWTGERAKINETVMSMCRDRRCTSRQLYGGMKKAVHNILISDDAALELWEILPEKRTSSMLAVAIAEREIRRIDTETKT